MTNFYSENIEVSESMEQFVRAFNYKRLLESNLQPWFDKYGVRRCMKCKDVLINCQPFFRKESNLCEDCIEFLTPYEASMERYILSATKNIEFIVNEEDLTNKPKEKEYCYIAQCNKCTNYGVNRLYENLYWTCLHCDAVGSILNDPNNFILDLNFLIPSEKKKAGHI